jgi:AraC-like DNA-binding protein
LAAIAILVLDMRRKGLYKSRIMSARSQQALLRRISGVQLIRLFDLLPDVSFFLKDRDGRFVALNRRGCEYCGVKSERAAFGKTDRDFFPRGRADEYMRDDRAVMRSGQAIDNRVESAPEAEGSPRLILTSKIPLRDARGKVIGLAGISRRIDQVRERPAAVAKLTKVVDYIHRRSRESIATRELAALAGLSVSQFDRTFRKTLGASPRQYLLRVRIEAACRPLAETDATIAAIAVEFGFHDHAHFTRSFRQVMGATPSAYRMDHQHPSSGR